MFAWHRHILDEIVNDVLDYARPIVTDKQQTLIRELEQMLSHTLQEHLVDTAEGITFLMEEGLFLLTRKDGENGRLTLNSL